MKYWIKKGDRVAVLTGKDRGKTGTVERLLRVRARVLVGGINMVKRHQKSSARAPHGGIIDKPSSLALANVMLWCEACGKPRRMRHPRANGQANRVCARCGSSFDVNPVKPKA